MENIQKWFDFIEIATEALMQGQEIDSLKPNIQIAIEPSFNNHVFLQLQIDNENVLWYRTTWLKLIDLPKFNDPIESLKYIGKKITPSLRHESGKMGIENVKHVIEFAKTLSIKPRIEKLEVIILDGCQFTLTIGTNTTRTTYKWHHAPDEWKDLVKLSNMLEEINDKL